MQNAAKDAINYWNKAFQTFHQREIAKTSQVFGGKMNPDELIKLKSSNNFYQKTGDNELVNWKSSNDFHKTNQEKLKNESDFEQIFTKDAGWIVATKGKNFIKKKTGTGFFVYKIKENSVFLGGGFIVLGHNKIKKEYLKTSNENLKRELNEILMKSRENDHIFCENCSEIAERNFRNPEILNKNPNKIIPSLENDDNELDNTIKYESSDDLDETVDFNEEIVQENQEKFRDILEKEDGISKMWVKTMDFLENNELDDAYTQVLASGDDIYLIRLMMKTGSCLKKLRRKTAVSLLKRLAMIGKSNFLQKMCLNFLEDFKDKNATEELKIEEQKKILDVLENMQRKKGALQVKSNQLHDYFVKKFK